MAPKMDPGGLLKRVRKTVGNSSAQKGLLDASGAAKQSENRILKSSAAIPAFPRGGRVAEIGHPGSLGTPTYQRKPSKNKQERDLTRPWAAGPANLCHTRTASLSLIHI